MCCVRLWSVNKHLFILRGLNPAQQLSQTTPANGLCENERHIVMLQQSLSRVTPPSQSEPRPSRITNQVRQGNDCYEQMDSGFTFPDPLSSCCAEGLLFVLLEVGQSVRGLVCSLPTANNCAVTPCRLSSKAVPSCSTATVLDRTRRLTRSQFRPSGYNCKASLI